MLSAGLIFVGFDFMSVSLDGDSYWCCSSRYLTQRLARVLQKVEGCPSLANTTSGYRQGQKNTCFRLYRHASSLPPVQSCLQWGTCDTAVYFLQAGVPGGLVGGPRAYQDQFRGFKSHRVHARRDFFLHTKLISGKRESVS